MAECLMCTIPLKDGDKVLRVETIMTTVDDQPATTGVMNLNAEFVHLDHLKRAAIEAPRRTRGRIW